MNRTRKSTIHQPLSAYILQTLNTNCKNSTCPGSQGYRNTQVSRNTHVDTTNGQIQMQSNLSYSICAALRGTVACQEWGLEWKDARLRLYALIITAVPGLSTGPRWPSSTYWPSRRVCPGRCATCNCGGLVYADLIVVSKIGVCLEKEYTAAPCHGSPHCFLSLEKVASANFSFCTVWFVQKGWFTGYF
jgi:hypothetical protein